MEVGATVGVALGAVVAVALGAVVAMAVGAGDGVAVGAMVGEAVDAEVGVKGGLEVAVTVEVGTGAGGFLGRQPAAIRPAAKALTAWRNLRREMVLYRGEGPDP